MIVQKKSPINVAASDGMNISVVGDTYRIVLGGAQTNGAFAVIDMLIPPGGGPGPHAHAKIDESFYVIDGEIEVNSEYGEYTATKGAFVNLPRGGVIHEFKNKTDTVAHLLCVVIPSGLDTFFQEIGTPVGIGKFLPPPAMDPASMKKLQAIAETHGQIVYPPDYLEKL